MSKKPFHNQSNKTEIVTPKPSEKVTPKGFYLTLGDPLSINVELIARGLENRELPLTLIGSLKHYQEQCDWFGFKSPYPFIDINPDNEFPSTKNLTPMERGNLAIRALYACKSLPDNQSHTILTLPIDKHAANLAGFEFPGQTEYFESLWGGEALMLLAGKNLRVGLATNHVPLSKIPENLSTELIVRKAKILHTSLQTIFQIPNPRLAIAGLNPHAGDGGLFGAEEKEIILPAIERLNKEGIRAKGPLSGDTVFWQATQDLFDGVLAMYHDQGLAPLKVYAFEEAVNISAGLKHLRLSPDHGPARDILGEGRASLKSFQSAISVVEKLGFFR